ncbi:MAG: FlgD immunoglobulin-like domain containing protein [Candidatus Eisenbacteria bacterium]
MNKGMKCGVLGLLSVAWWIPGADSVALADTYSFGYFDAETGFAVPGDVWTFDHGSANPLEGWAAYQTPGVGPQFRAIDAAEWAGGGNPIEAPILSGQGSAWVGSYQAEADDLCWPGRLGYGNNWTQRLVSPELGWGGGGDVTLRFLYFNDSEPNFDRTRVILRRDDDSELSLNGSGFDGRVGITEGEVVGAQFERVLTASDLLGTSTFRIVFEMTSDVGWSDEDGSFDSEFGAFAVDDVELSGDLTSGNVTYGFEADLDGWGTEYVGPAPSPTELGIASIGDYPIPDPCGLSGNVLELHDDAQGHGADQFETVLSNPVSLAGLGDITDIRLECDLMTGDSPVLYRTGFRYYPVPCPGTGLPTYETRMTSAYFSLFDEGCVDFSYSALDRGIPEGVEQVEAVIELVGAFPRDEGSQDTASRSGATSFAPLFDNVAVVVEASDPAGVDDPRAEGRVLLQTAAPNPLRGTTTISLSASRTEPVRLDIVDVAGRIVVTLHEGMLEAERHELTWDGMDARGRLVPSGVYWTRLTTADRVERMRLTVAR